MRESLADVLSLDYVGALIGSVAFPILLLPSLRLITASFAIGLTNALVALPNVFRLRDHLDDYRWVPVYIYLTIAALFVLTLGASNVMAYTQDHLYFDRVVWKTQSPHQSLVVTNTWKHNDVRLFIDGHLQSAQVDEYCYHEALVHPVMSWTPAPPETVLILGGGDGMAVREVLRHPSVPRIDLVDLDPEMTRLGTEFAPVKRLNGDSVAPPKVHAHNEDAFLYVREIDRRYDRVIIDFPDPHNEALSKLYSLQVYSLVVAVMTQNATLVTQSSSPFSTTNTCWTVARTLEEMFPDVVSYQTSVPSFGIWGGPRGLPHPRRRAGRPARWAAHPHVRSLRRRARISGRPDARQTAGSEFDLNPAIYERYSEDCKRR